MIMSRTNLRHFPQTKVPFHVQDDRGRWVGCIIYHSEFDLADYVDGECIHVPNDLTAGHYNSVCIMVTRDGKAFGALQPLRYFTDTDEMHAYIKKTVAERRKRAEKQFSWKDAE